jgi:type IV secretory pathway VirB10-like protein
VKYSEPALILIVAVSALILACSGDKKPASSQPVASAPETAAVASPAPTQAPVATEAPAPPPAAQAPAPAAAPPQPAPPTSAPPRPPTPPSISLSPNPVAPSGLVTVTGRGFAPNSAITITGSSGLISLPLGTAMADAQGSFVDSDNVPSIVPPGTYTVTAVDSARNTATTQMTVAR